MVLEGKRKKELITGFAEHGNDTGSCSVQIAVFTERINNLTEHFKAHRKDFNSRVGLLRLVSQRKRLLDYLKREDVDRYRRLIEKLKLKK